MERRYSSITTFSADAVRTKEANEKTSGAADGPKPASVGGGDVNTLLFLTKPLANYIPTVQASGSSYYNTISVVDPSNYGNVGRPIFNQGTTLLVNQAGSPNVTTSYVVPGRDPDGFASMTPGMMKIKRREKLYYNSRGDPYYSWMIKTVDVPLDYAVQPDEMIDGGMVKGELKARFSISNLHDTSSVIPYRSTHPIYNVKLYGNSFPTGPSGGFLSSPSEVDTNAWSGTVYEGDVTECDSYSILPYNGGDTDIPQLNADGTVQQTGVKISWTDQPPTDVAIGLDFFEVKPLVSVFIGPYPMISYSITTEYGWYTPNFPAVNEAYIIGNVYLPKDAKTGKYPITVIWPKGGVSQTKDYIEVIKPEVDWNAYVKAEEDGTLPPPVSRFVNGMPMDVGSSQYFVR